MEIIRNHILNLQIENESDVGFCRRKTVNLAKELGFNEVKCGEIAIIVTELVTNVLKHSGGSGRILVCHLEKDEQKAIEIWCCDKGKGIADLEKATSDGFTDKGTLGIGLGSIRRFSDEFEVNPTYRPALNGSDFSSLEKYTNCIRSLKWLPTKQWQGSNRNLIIGAASRSKPGENLNGDCYIYNHFTPSKTMAAVIDGLGHGTNAHVASQLAKEQLLLKSNLPVNSLLDYTHQSIKGSRGVVIGLVSIDTEINKLSFSGIGNIEGFLMTSEGKKSLLSYGGIVGHKIRTPRLFEFNFNPGDLLFMYSDGINSRWNIDDIDLQKHPQQISEYIINTYSRQNDDATILIIRYHS